MELGIDTAHPVADLAASTGLFTQIEILPDLSGLDRLLSTHRSLEKRDSPFSPS